MPDYLPIFAGHEITYTTSAAVTGGQLVAITGAGTVGPTSAATGAWVGVAGFDAPAGVELTVSSGGIQQLTASGAIAAGALVAAAAAGAVATFSGSDYSLLLGVAVSAATSGNPIQVRLAR